LALMNANNDPLDVPICLPFCGADRREGLWNSPVAKPTFFPLAALRLWAQVLETVQRWQSSVWAKMQALQAGHKKPRRNW